MKLHCNTLASHQTNEGVRMNGSMSAVICSPIIASLFCFVCVWRACARYDSAQSKNHWRSRSASVRGSDDTSCTSA